MIRRIALVGALVLACGCDESSPAPRPAPAPNGFPTPLPDEDDVPERDSAPAIGAPPGGGPTEGTPEADDGAPQDDRLAWCAPRDPKLKPMQVLRFRFTSKVKARKPVDKLNVARGGSRVYTHFTMRNRSGRKRCLKLTFRVGGKKRSEVVLKVGKSWSWRTWAYNTVHASDAGKRLEVDVKDDQGATVLTRSLAVLPPG